MRGSVKKCGNSWMFVVDIGVDPLGKRKQKRRKGFRDEEEARSALTCYLENEWKIDQDALKIRKKHNISTYVKKNDKTKNRNNIITELAEKEIEEMLINDLSIVEDGLNFIGNQVSIGDSVIDIIARDKDGTLVIIEVKNKDNDERIANQVLYYPTLFEEKTRIITIAPSYKNKIYFSLLQISTYIRPIELKRVELKNGSLKISRFYK